MRGCDLNPHIDRSATSCKNLILNDTPILRGQIQRYKARVLDSLVLEEKEILELPSIQMVEGIYHSHTVERSKCPFEMMRFIVKVKTL